MPATASRVGSVGSPRGVKTHISFGQDYLIADLIEKEEREIEKVKARISQLDIDMRKSGTEQRGRPAPDAT